MFLYNQGRNFTAVVLTDDGQYVVTAFNVGSGESMVVSNAIPCIHEATRRAQMFAGHSVTEPLNPDDVEQYLSERLGF